MVIKWQFPESFVSTSVKRFFHIKRPFLTALLNSVCNIKEYNSSPIAGYISVNNRAWKKIQCRYLKYWNGRLIIEPRSWCRCFVLYETWRSDFRHFFSGDSSITEQNNSFFIIQLYQNINNICNKILYVSWFVSALYSMTLVWANTS
jgi:hypothetical protein